MAKRNSRLREFGYLYRGDGTFVRDSQRKRPISDKALRKIANRPHGEITYTCVPPGSGIRIALDRDEDGLWNGDEWNINFTQAQNDHP